MNPIKTIVLKRIGENIDGIFGVLLEELNGQLFPFVVTLEKKWDSNKPFVSCIPLGEFTCKRIISKTYGETFEIFGVTGRDNVLFHWGNFQDNSQGCILIAEYFEKIFNKKTGEFQNGIADSKKGFQQFMDILKGNDSFKLLILRAYT